MNTTPTCAATKARKAIDQPARHTLLATFVVLLLAVVWSGLGVVDDARQMRSLYHELGEVQQQYDQLLENNSRLILERSTLSSHQAVEEVATEKMDMHFPDDIRQVAR